MFGRKARKEKELADKIIARVSGLVCYACILRDTPELLAQREELLEELRAHAYFKEGKVYRGERRGE